MSSLYSVERHWMTHSGGTKFYQIFRIARTRKGAPAAICSAFHYAGFKGNHTPFRRPVVGGQVEIKAGDYGPDKLSEKLTPRNGGVYKVEDRRSENFASTDAFRRYLREEFGQARADEILIGLGMSTDPDAAEWEPSDGLEDKTIETEIDLSALPDNCGTW